MLTWSEPRSKAFDLACSADWLPRSRTLADPVAWMIALSIGEIAADTEWEVAGLVVVSGSGPAATLALTRQQAARARVSPRAFAAAGPGSVVGLACIVHGITGPTLMASATAGRGPRVLEPVIDRWLRTGSCDAVIVCEHRADSETIHTVDLNVVCRVDPQ